MLLAQYVQQYGWTCWFVLCRCLLGVVLRCAGSWGRRQVHRLTTVLVHFTQGSRSHLSTFETQPISTEVNQSQPKSITALSKLNRSQPISPEVIYTHPKSFAALSKLTRSHPKSFTLSPEVIYRHSTTTTATHYNQFQDYLHIKSTKAMPSNEWCAVAAPTSESNGGVSSQLQLLEVDPVFPNQSHNAPRVRVDRKAARYFHYVDPETKAPISTDSPGGVHMCKKSDHCHHKGYTEVNGRNMENHLRSKHPEDFHSNVTHTAV